MLISHGNLNLQRLNFKEIINFSLFTYRWKASHPIKLTVQKHLFDNKFIYSFRLKNCKEEFKSNNLQLNIEVAANDFC